PARAGDRGGSRVPGGPRPHHGCRGAANTRDPHALVSDVADRRPVRVAVVAEFYPSRHDPVLGVWAHRQAIAARDAGAEVQVLVLHRLVPPRAALAGGPARALRSLGQIVRQPLVQHRDGLRVTYVPYVSPPRDVAYPRWGAWAAPALALALR